MRLNDIVVLSGIVHLTTALLSVSSYHPDEYYQGVERAYYVVYGHGIVSWEWTAQYSIRSHFYILPYVGLFSVLKVFGIHHDWFFRVGPRLVNACFAVLADVAFAKMLEFSYRGKSKSIEKDGSMVEMGVYLHVFNAFLLYTSHRSLVNSFEMFMYLYALYFWFVEHEVPDDGHAAIRKHHHDVFYLTHIPELFQEYKRWYNTSDAPTISADVPLKLPLYKCISVFIMSVAICARPTSLFLFLPLVCRYALCFLDSSKAMLALLYQSAFFMMYCALAVAGVVYIDTNLYCQVNTNNGDGENECEMVVPMLRFVDFNVVKGYSAFFGEHAWHWNFTQGIPQVLGLYTFLLLVLVIRMIRSSKDTEHPNTANTAIDNKKEEGMLSDLAAGLGYDALCYVVALSLLSRHQEARFLVPVLPACHLFLAEMVQYFSVEKEEEEKEKEKRKKDMGISLYTMKSSAVVCIVAHALLSLYLLRGHQSGAEVAFAHVDNLFREYQYALSSLKGGDTKMHVHLLAPCFSFPSYSHLHPPANMSVVLYQPDCDIKYTLQNRDSGSAVFRKHPLFFYRAVTGVHTRPPNSTRAQYSQEIWPYADVILTFDSYVDFSHSRGHALGKYLLGLGYVPQLTVHHAHLRYDYDDNYVNKLVLIYTSKEISSLFEERRKDDERV